MSDGAARSRQTSLSPCEYNRRWRCPMANTPTMSRRLQVFLCHASADKPAVRALYHRLQEDGFQPWPDEEDLLPGQDWEPQIRRAVRESDVVLVCLSQSSVSKKGFVQKEIKFALDTAEEQPEETIYVR